MEVAIILLVYGFAAIAIAIFASLGMGKNAGKYRMIKDVAGDFSLRYLKQKNLPATSFIGEIKNYLVKLELYKTADLEKFRMSIMCKSSQDISFLLTKQKYENTVPNMKSSYERLILQQATGKRSLDLAPWDISLIAVLNDSLCEKLDEFGKMVPAYNINENQIKIEDISFPFSSKAALKNAVSLAVEIADEINRPMDNKARLIDNYKNCKSEDDRLNNLYYILTWYESDDETRDIIEELETTKDFRKKVIYAIHKKEEGMATLIDMLQNNPGYDEAEICMLIRALATCRIGNDYSVLIDIYKKYNSDRILQNIIYLIRVFKLKNHEPFLIENIENDGPGISDLILKSLGEFGTIKSVEKLHKLAKSTLNPMQKREYSGIIAQIQSRLGNAEKGWISVVDDEKLDGALSKEEVDKKGLLSREE